MGTRSAFLKILEVSYMKKLLCVGAAAALLAAGVTGCQKSEEETAAANAGGTQTAQTTITWWAFPTFGNEGLYEREVIAAFEAANPDIKVNLETIDFTSGPDKIVAAIEGGTAPDVLFDAPGRIIEYGRNGKLVSLDDMFTDEFRTDVGNDALLSSCSDGQTYWMYPLSISPFCMSINREMWEEVGALQYVNLEGDRAWTTENFIKALDAFAAADKIAISVYCGGQGGDQGTRALVTNLYSGQMANADMTAYTMDSPENIRALQLIKEYADKGAIDKGVSIVASDELQRYQQGIFGSSICWGTSNALNYATDAFTQVTLPFPSDDGVPELEYLVNGFCVFDNQDAARAEAAKKFVAFICDDAEWGPKSVIQSGAFPVRSSFGNLYPGNDEYALLSSWTQYYGPYYNTMKGFNGMRTEWWNMLQRILLDTQPVEEAAAECASKATAGIN